MSINLLPINTNSITVGIHHFIFILKLILFLLLLPSSEASIAALFSNKLSESAIVPPVQTTGVVAALVNAPAVTCDRTIATLFMVGSTIPTLQTTEVYDGHDHVEVFDELRDTQVWYVIKAVRVRFVYNNVPDNNLQLFLLDKYGKTFTAVVYDCRLLPRYKLMNLVGSVFEIHHFQIGYTAYGFPRYEGYTLHRNLYEKIISKNTRVVPTKGDLAKTIPNFPLPVGSLKDLADDTTSKRMIVYVAGRVIRGRRIRDPNPYDTIRVRCWELYIQDKSVIRDQVMLVILHHYHNNALGKTPFAVRDKMFVYISRVKLIHTTRGDLP